MCLPASPPELMLQVQGLSLDDHGVRFGCCPGHGIAVCAGPAAQRLKRASQIMLMISAMGGKGGGMMKTCLLLATVRIVRECFRNTSAQEELCKDANWSLRFSASVHDKTRSLWLRAFGEHRCIGNRLYDPEPHLFCLSRPLKKRHFGCRAEHADDSPATIVEMTGRGQEHCKWSRS